MPQERRNIAGQPTERLPGAQGRFARNANEPTAAVDGGRGRFEKETRNVRAPAREQEEDVMTLTEEDIVPEGVSGREGHTLDVEVEELHHPEDAVDLLERRFDDVFDRMMSGSVLSEREKKQNYDMLEKIAADVLKTKESGNLSHADISILDQLYADIMGDETNDGIIETAHPDWSGELSLDDLVAESDYEMTERQKEIIEKKGEYAMRMGESSVYAKEHVFFRADLKMVDLLSDNPDALAEYFSTLEKLDDLEQKQRDLTFRKGHSFSQKTGRAYAVLMEGSPAHQRASSEMQNKSPEELAQLRLQLDTLSRFDRDSYYQAEQVLLAERVGLKMSELRYLKDLAENDSEIAEYYEDKKQELYDRLNRSAYERQQEAHVIYAEILMADRTLGDGGEVYAERFNMDVPEFRSYLLNEMQRYNDQIFDIQNYASSFEYVTGEEYDRQYLNSYNREVLGEMKDVLSVMEFDDFNAEYQRIEADLAGVSEDERRKALAQFVGDFVEIAAADYFVPDEGIEINKDYLTPSEELFNARLEIRDAYSKKIEHNKDVLERFLTGMVFNGRKFETITKSKDDLHFLKNSLQFERGELGNFDENIVDMLLSEGVVSREFYDRFQEGDLSDDVLEGLIDAQDVLSGRLTSAVDEMKSEIKAAEDKERLVIYPEN